MAKAAATTKTVTVTAKQIASALAEKHEMQKKSTIALFDEFFAAITKSLKKGERVRVGDLGILQVRKRAARMGRNPQTGEPIKIKASKKVAFRASKVLKESI
ncbi:HU family DNA-binding protein [Ferrovibrio xuzhouensis]|uniref:HU family DNA-binding protein n=1 Tax=Ferrovibrio xuzhouensis TaxID=1576914 RepID=A0ABV7VGJ2_9PROT